MPSKSDTSRNFQPDIFHPFYFIRSQLYKKLAQYAPELYGDVLDFGCGAKPYRHLFDHCASYVGVDFEGAGHSHAQEQIDFFYDGKTLPFKDQSFDCVFCSEVFEHLFNLKEILGEINRVMKPGGKILITCPFTWPEHERPYDYARYTVFALRSILADSGFGIVKEDKSGNFFLATHQLTTVYVYEHVCGKLNFKSRTPFLAKMARAILVPLMNIGGIIGNAILPDKKDFYLNNIIVAEKSAE